MQPDSYISLHNSMKAATKRRDVQMIIRRFNAVATENEGSTDHEDRFDAAWAKSCMASLYLRLKKPTVAERLYIESTNLFEKNDQPVNAAWQCVGLAELYVDQKRTAEAEAQLKANVEYLTRFWGSGHYHVLGAQAELKHFQLTGEMIKACWHRWCPPCGVDEFGVGFDSDKR